jgi:hypothetical protein
VIEDLCLVYDDRQIGRYTPIMRIAVVGGVERMQSRLVDIAGRAGHQLEFHHGHMSGPASNRLQNLVERSDVIVIVTDVNSHCRGDLRPGCRPAGPPAGAPGPPLQHQPAEAFLN